MCLHSITSAMWAVSSLMQPANWSLELSFDYVYMSIRQAHILFWLSTPSFGCSAKQTRRPVYSRGHWQSNILFNLASLSLIYMMAYLFVNWPLLCSRPSLLLLDPSNVSSSTGIVSLPMVHINTEVRILVINTVSSLEFLENSIFHYVYLSYLTSCSGSLNVP